MKRCSLMVRRLVCVMLLLVFAGMILAPSYSSMDTLLIESVSKIKNIWYVNKHIIVVETEQSKRNSGIPDEYLGVYNLKGKNISGGLWEDSRFDAYGDRLISNTHIKSKDDLSNFYHTLYDKAGNSYKTEEKLYEVYPFYHGYAKVQKQVMDKNGFGKRVWGFINRKGKTVIKPAKYLVEDFSEGLFACVETQKGIGFCDLNNKLVIPAKYNWAGKFSEGLAAVEILDKPNLGYINKSGEMKIKPRFVAAKCFVGGLAPVKPVKPTVKWGYINKKGNMVIKPQWKFAAEFSKNGIARVCFENSLSMYGDDESECTYIDKKGQYITKKRFRYAYDFKGSYAKVSIRGKDGENKRNLIGRKGQLLLKKNVEDVVIGDDGIVVINDKGNWYILDSQLKKKTVLMGGSKEQ